MLIGSSARFTARIDSKSVGVDPFSADCTTQADSAGSAFTDCCIGPNDDASLSPTSQERAWTSPIWYQPDGIARVRGRGA